MSTSDASSKNEDAMRSMATSLDTRLAGSTVTRRTGVSSTVEFHGSAGSVDVVNTLNRTRSRKARIRLRHCRLAPLSSGA